MDQLNTILKHPIFVQIKEYLNHPYAGLILGVLLFVYISYVSPMLPSPFSSWLSNPSFKLVFKIALLVGVTLIHSWSPMVALWSVVIIMVITFIISKQNASTPTRPLSTSLAPPLATSLAPNDDEMAQLNQEIAIESELSSEGLHPMNRPTKETIYVDNRVLDPNDPNHPGMKIDPNADVAIYELNPPFANKELPSGEQLNVSTINLPKGGPTRYSAYHGYKID
jgi:hypothetical protein